MKRIIFSLLIFATLLMTCANHAGEPSLIRPEQLPTREYIELSYGIAPLGAAAIAKYVIVYPTGQVQQTYYKLLRTGEFYGNRRSTGEIPHGADKPDITKHDQDIYIRLAKELNNYTRWSSKKTKIINFIRPAIPADAKPKSCCTLQ